MERLSCSEKIFAKLALIGNVRTRYRHLQNTRPYFRFCSSVSL
jgi:hypothetical protein